MARPCCWCKNADTIVNGSVYQGRGGPVHGAARSVAGSVPLCPLEGVVLLLTRAVGGRTSADVIRPA